MMIAIVNGRPRLNGATATLLKEAQRYLAEKHGAQVLYVDLSKLDMRFCRGCLACYRTGRCAITGDEVEAIADQIKSADGIIIGSPTYGSNVSGLLKNFMDRGHFIVEQSLRGKYGFAVATEEIADGNQVIGILRKFFLVSGAARSGQCLVKLDFNADPFSDPKTKQRLHKRLTQFFQIIERRKGKSLFERIFTDWLVVQMIWKPVFLRQPKKYAGVLDLWRQKQIV